MRLGVIVGVVVAVSIAAMLFIPMLNPFSGIGKSIEADTIPAEDIAEGAGQESTPASADTITPPPSSQTPTVQKSDETSLQELREYALSKINEDRQKFGIEPVKLSTNQAAQAHAENLYSMLGSSTHWTSDGMKPYMRYTMYNGTGYVAQNVHAGMTYRDSDIMQCRLGLAYCTKINIHETLEESQYSMMYDDAHADWGHRDNILDKHHTHVSIGIAYDDYYFAHVQNFESNHISFSKPISEHDRIVNIQGEITGEHQLSSIVLYYDESPSAAVYERDKDLESYGIGEAIAGVARQGWTFGDIRTINAGVWSEDGNAIDISFDISPVVTKEGVYTVVVFLEDTKGESFPAASHSIFKIA